MNTDWKPFPPPGPGVYDIRDSTGVRYHNVNVTRNAKGKLKCLGMLAGTTMTNSALGYQWRAATKSGASHG